MERLKNVAAKTKLTNRNSPTISSKQLISANDQEPRTYQTTKLLQKTSILEDGTERIQPATDAA